MSGIEQLKVLWRWARKLFGTRQIFWVKMRCDTGEVTVTHVKAAILRIGLPHEVQCYDGGATEIWFYAHAVDRDHAIERSMPAIVHLRNQLLDFGNIDKMDKGPISLSQ